MQLKDWLSILIPAGVTIIGLIINYLYDKNMKLTNSANDICYIDNKID